MRRRFLPFGAGLVMLLALALAPAAQAAGWPPDFECSGAYVGGTYGNVIVPANGYCSFTDSTILGNVDVRPGGGLDLNSSGGVGPLSSSPMTVHGNLLVHGANAYANINPGAIVDGTTTLANANDIDIYQGTVHDLIGINSQAFYIYQAQIDGQVAAERFQSGGSISANDIRGNLLINGTAPSGSSWYINGPGQTIRGNVVVTNNQVFTDIDTNQIGQNLVCAGNTPPPVAFANQVGGRAVGQCANATNPNPPATTR